MNLKSSAGILEKVFTRKKHPVKLTALHYLKEVLQNEDYEACSEIIEIACEFGAEEAEIQFLLEDHRRTPTS